MSQIKDIRRVFGGVNTDDDQRDLPNGDYLIESKNLSSGVSIKGTLSNLKGNTKVNYTLPSGNNFCIGALRDIQRNAIIYFLFNDLGNHSILHYFCATNSIEAILEPTPSIPFTTNFLNFQKDSKIHSANILNDVLLWVDGTNPPRKVNIKYAKDFLLQLTPSAVNKPYNNLIATGTLAEKLEFIDAIKRPDIGLPLVDLGYDASRATNFIRNKMIQARYRYIYDDQEPSVWSTGSAVTLPQNQENIFGPYTTSSDNNYVDVTYNSGHPTVIAIEIAFRFDNFGTWQKIDTPIKKYDNDNQPLLPNDTLLTYRFYNDIVLIPLTTTESLKNYDSIPLISKTQEIIDGNRLVYANNLEGYDNPQLEVTMEAQLQTIDDSFTSEIIQFTSGFGDSWMGFPLAAGNVKQGQVIEIRVHTLFGYTIVRYTITPDDMLNYPYSLNTSYIDFLYRGFGFTGSGFIVSNAGAFTHLGIDYVGLISQTTAAPANDALTDLVVYGVNNRYEGFKKGAFHKFGIVYYDYADRDGGVVTDDSMQLYVPYLPEILTNPTTNDIDTVYTEWALATIKHRPPIWAERYQIVYSTNNLRKYTQFIIYTLGPLNTSNNVTTIDCSYIQDYITDLKQGSVDFQFEKGDRLRFISNTEYYCPQYIETEVLGYDTTTKQLSVRAFEQAGVIGNMATQSFDGVLCELFAYKAETDNVIYYEFAQNYGIINAGTPTRSHAGNLQNQNGSLSISAKVRMSRGDTYQYKRYFTKGSTIVPTNIESENFSDYYASQNIDISRIQVVTNSVSKRYEQQIRYGGRFFQNTNTNLLLSFNGDSVDNLDTRYGPINKVCTIGYVLKCLQTKKITSVYINRNQIFNADGSPQLIQTDQVLSNKEVSETDFGCIHPESVCKDERQMFFFDVNTGSMVQDSANGLFPISDYKFITGMRNKAQAINASSDTIYVYASVDNYLETVNISFVNQTDPLSSINDTYIYNTNQNRWKPRLSYIPEYVCSNGLVFVSFKDGELYTHNTNDVRNNFYGVQYDSVISIVSNVNPEKTKVFDSLWQKINKVFGSPNVGDISIIAGPNYPQGMQSRLLASRYVAKEGGLYADFMRDALTPNMTTQDALINGRKLRGQALKVNLSNSDTEEVTIYEIIINSTISDIS